MNPQTVGETKRILHVVDDLIEDISVLAVLPPYLTAIPSADMGQIMGAFSTPNGGREAQTQLNDHFDIERRLESGDVTQEDVADHHLSARAVLDTLRQAGYPRFQAQYPPNEALQNVGHILTVLRKLLHDRCHTTVEDDVVKYTILHDTVNREKSASADVQALNREYHNEKESRRVEVEKRNAAIRKVKEEVEHLRVATEAEVSNFVKVSKEMTEGNADRFRQELEELGTKQREIETELRNVETKCAAEEESLRAARSKKEGTVFGTINDYDSQMNTLSSVMATLRKELDEDTERLAEVERELNALGNEQAEYDLERKIAEQRKGHFADIVVRQHSAARVMQAFIRSWAVRLHASQKGKKGKKGKK